MIIKVCGHTCQNELQRDRAVAYDWLGLVFVRRSPRYAGEIPFETGPTPRVGVFQDASLDEMRRIGQAWNLSGIQLHGEESAELAISLRHEGYTVIKALGVDSPQVLAKAEEIYPPGSIDYFLFDSPGGGTGRHFNWEWLAAYQGNTPFLLAGGIGPGDAPRIASVHHAQFAGIDLNSRFETAPGIKDYELLRKFIEHELPR